MKVRVTKIQDLKRTTHTVHSSTITDPDKTGPITKPRFEAVGELRRLLGWVGHYAVHEAALSFNHAFSAPGARLLVYGTPHVVSGPIQHYRIDGEMSEEPNGHYVEINTRRERVAIVETLNSIYEVKAFG